MKVFSDALIQTYRTRIPSVVENEPLAKRTSFHVGGAARLFVAAHSTEELLTAIREARAIGLPWSVLGGGTNVLAADDGYAGVVIQAANRSLVIHDEIVTVEAGALTSLTARQVTDAGLTGFEWAVTLPGTLGGALFGNAGCFGGEMKDVVLAVDVLRVADGVRLTLSNEDCRFAYRDSRFKHEAFVLLGCDLRLTRTPDPSAGRALMESYLQKRKVEQPLGAASCGCAFKNFEYTDEAQLEILKRQVSEIPPNMLAAKRLGAGWLIEQVGLKGKRLGQVRVSERHGNFLLTDGPARAQDVLALMSLVKMKVRDELGIELQEEVQLLGFDPVP